MKVILFDGVCNLCNASINWLIDHDRDNQFQYSSLQSDYGKKLVEQFGLQDDYMDTIMLYDGNKIYTRSDAALRIIKSLGYPYKALYAAVIVPRFIRHGLYNFIARNRYKWFGKRDSCRIPTPELKAKFLE